MTLPEPKKPLFRMEALASECQQVALTEKRRTCRDPTMPQQLVAEMAVASSAGSDTTGAKLKAAVVPEQAAFTSKANCVATWEKTAGRFEVMATDDEGG